MGCWHPPELPLVDEVPITADGSCASARNAFVACAVDGDTADLVTCGGGERIRLLGIDAPETAHDGEPSECWAEEAHQALAGEIVDRTVTLEFDRECFGVFGRTLAYIWKDDVLVNEWLLEEGLARQYPEWFDAEPLRYADRLDEAERHAKERGIGLWAACEGPAED